MPHPKMRDAALSLPLVLPVGAAVVVAAAGLAVGPVTAQGDFAPNGNGEFILETPALTVTQLPNAATITFDIIESANANLSSPVVVHPAALVLTGAGGVGCAANFSRWRPASNITRYIGYQATGVSGVAASNASASLTYVV